MDREEIIEVEEVVPIVLGGVLRIVALLRRPAPRQNQKSGFPVYEFSFRTLGSDLARR
jgi:hypothetical protein